MCVVLCVGEARNNGGYNFKRVAVLDCGCDWKKEINNYKNEVRNCIGVKNVDFGDETFVSFTINSNRYMIAAAPL